MKKEKNLDEYRKCERHGTYYKKELEGKNPTYCIRCYINKKF